MDREQKRNREALFTEEGRNWWIGPYLNKSSLNYFLLLIQAYISSFVNFRAYVCAMRSVSPLKILWRLRI